MKKTILSLTTFIGGALVTASTVFAAANTNVGLGIDPAGGFNKLGTLEFPNLITALVQLIMVIAALLFFFMLIAGGIQWIVSGGDKAGTEGAKNRITAALIGLVVVFSAWAIANLIGTFFAVDILNLQIPVIK